MTNNVNQTLQNIIGSTSKGMSDKVAVVFADKQLTFAELELRSNQLARRLVQMQAKPGTLVGLCVERSIDMVVGLLGILKSGAAYIPIDPAYPADRISYMLDDSEADIIVTQSLIAPTLPDHKAKTVCLDTDWADISSGSGEPLGEIACAEDLAYIIYTSGSTGRPKGVEIPHRALANFILSMRDKPGLSEDDRLLAVTTLSFDIAGLELYLPLAAGATLVIASRDTAGDGRELAKTLREEEISVMQATPASWRLLLEAGWKGTPGLRILCGGEALPRELAEQLLPCCDELWNLYGPTETTIWSSLSKVTSGSGSVPIGSAIANTQLYILDDNMNPVRSGNTGELYIGGKGLARGYFKRDDLTKERFLNDPFSADEDSRMYRTGDLARVREDGQLEHLGRVDFQVKVRGFRIELGEIEAVLEQQDTIRQAVVTAREDIPGEKRLVAYVRIHSADSNSPSNQALRAALSEKLPDYMVPGFYVTLADFPLTPNGKVDRNALPEPEDSRPELGDDFVAPRNESEAKLTAIWSEVLRIEKIGINDNYFELGGDSLRVAQIATRVRDTFTVDMPLRLMFDNPTIAELTIELLALEPTVEVIAELPMRIVSRDEKIPLTFSQERVWFLHQMNPQNLAYNFIALMEFNGELDVDAVELSLQEVLNRHESFRTTFPTVDGGPVQNILPASEFNLPVFDLRGLSADEQTLRFDDWSQGEYQHRFDLAKETLVRWHLFRFSDSRNILVHMEQHLVHDGWAFNLFVKEFTAIYEAYSKGEPCPLAEPPIQLADFATWQHEWMSGKISDLQLDYWKAKFESIPPILNLPTKGARPPIQTFRGNSLRPEIPLETCNGLRALAREEESTLFMTMLAAFIALLHRYSGETDVAVGTFFANRRAWESESVIAMILNNVVIRASLENNPSVRELMKHVRNVVLEDSAYQDVPFDRVVDAVHPKRDLSMNPLFQVMFSFHDEPMPDKGLAGIDLQIKPVISNGSAKFDLGVIGIPHSAQKLGMAQGCAEDGLTMIWEHNTDIFDTETIAQMVEHYKTMLRGMIDNPDQRISDLPLADAAQTDQMLNVWNDTAANYPIDSVLHEVIEEQARRTPKANAVCFESKSLSYEELADRSTQLANHLVAKGVASNDLVGICLDRSERMLIAILGVLKSGAAYVPIDPAFPQDRKRFMIEDASLAALITEGSLSVDLPTENMLQINLDDAETALAAQSKTLQAIPSITPQSTAYVIFTSGSTGRPKGVQIPHRAIVNFLGSMREKPGISAQDKLFAVTTLSFDIAGLELLLPLTVGAQVTIASKAVTTNGEELARQIEASGTTIMQATPTTWQMLLDSGWQGSTQFTALCGGEPLPRSLAEELLPRVKQLWNMYGPTETTIWSAIEQVESGEGNVPIGRPIGNTQMYILDQYNNPAPVGTLGELCIGGAGVALGYLNRPDLTAEKFVSNPIAGTAGEVIYRTGDLARYRADGTLECLGRIDQQVKLRGFRIELGEIEALLDQCDGIRQATVLMREDFPGEKRLVCYYLAQSSEGAKSTDLRSALRVNLPDYMIPTIFMEMDSFPLTPNEKIDRKAFPIPDDSRPDLKETYVAPTSESQKSLAKIWAAVLGMEKVGIEDNFFELGGHSLMVIKMLSRIDEEMGIELKIHHVFDDPTIVSLDKVLLGAQLNQIDDDDLLKMLQEVENS